YLGVLFDSSPDFEPVTKPELTCRQKGAEIHQRKEPLGHAVDRVKNHEKGLSYGLHNCIGCRPEYVGRPAPTGFATSASVKRRFLLCRRLTTPCTLVQERVSDRRSRGFHGPES